MAIELTADQLGQLSAVLRLSGNRNAPSERRRTQRLDVRSSVSIAIVENGQPGSAIAVRARDLSPRGVALMHTAEMKIGQQFVLTLHRDDGPAVQLLCTAVHCQAGKGRLFTIGAEFTCTLSDLPVQRVASAAEIDHIRQCMLD